MFRQNLMQPAGEQDLQQRWFPGDHGDVGGGYRAGPGRLWQRPFEWILEEAWNAAGAELLVSQRRLTTVMQGRTPQPWLAPQHESLTGAWWLMEWVRNPAAPGRHRIVPPGALIDESTLLRIRERPGYAPPNLSGRFLETVQRLSAVPGSLPYEP